MRFPSVLQAVRNYEANVMALAQADVALPPTSRASVPRMADGATIAPRASVARSATPDPRGIADLPARVEAQCPRKVHFADEVPGGKLVQSITTNNGFSRIVTRKVHFADEIPGKGLVQSIVTNVGIIRVSTDSASIASCESFQTAFEFQPCATPVNDAGEWFAGRINHPEAPIVSEYSRGGAVDHAHCHSRNRAHDEAAATNNIARIEPTVTYPDCAPYWPENDLGGYEDQEMLYLGANLERREHSSTSFSFRRMVGRLFKVRFVEV